MIKIFIVIAFLKSVFNCSLLFTDDFENFEKKVVISDIEKIDTGSENIISA